LLRLFAGANFGKQLVTRQESTAMKVAILDDSQNAALSMADWSAVREKGEITVFTDSSA
jgi:hypothetical protein